MKVFETPAGAARDLGNEIEEKARRLTAAAAGGAEFFALTVGEPLETCRWILASFYSPLAVVPLAPNLPPLARAAALAQLPRGSWVEIDSLPPPAPGAPAPKPLNKDYCVIFSSGSTGAPKGVALTGEAFRASALAHAEHSRAANATWLLDLSPAHVGGFSVLTRAHFLQSAVALGGSRFRAAETLAWLRSGIVNGLSVVPVTLARLLEEKPSATDLAPLQLALLGGAAADPGLVRAALARGVPVRRTYGMTENASQAATETAAEGGLRALPGVEIGLSAEGEIEVGSPFLARGYYRDGRLEALPLRKGRLPTGDLGALEHGVLTVSGRRTELINTGGVKVFPAEIENALLGLAGLREAAAFGLPDPVWGEAVCLVVVGEGVTAAAVHAHLEPRLDRRKLPKQILFAPSLPRSATGKVLRAELRARVLAKT